MATQTSSSKPEADAKPEDGNPVPVHVAVDKLGYLINRVVHGNETVVLSRHGKELVKIVPV